MKRPRTSDFDPNTPAQEREQQSLKSPMNDFPAIESPSQTPHNGVPQAPVLPVSPIRDIPEGSPPANGARQKIKSRHPFDVYEDQVEELKRLSVEDRMRGGSGSMSAMLRQAIDEFIAKVRQPQGE